MTLEVFTFGEAMLRLSVPIGERLETAESFDVHVAGSEANVAAGLAGLGRRVAWWSRLPDGPLGRRVIRELTAAGVDCSRITLEPEGRLGVYFVELAPPPRAVRVVYDRAGSLASTITAEQIPWDLVERVRLVHVSGITPALSDTCREATATLLRRARDQGALVSLDVNYRSKLWPPSRAAAVLSEILEGIDLLVCAARDATVLFGLDEDPEQLPRILADRFSVRRVVVTSGASGAWWFDGGREGHQPAIPVTIVDRLGAGDALMAGIIDGILDDDLERGVRRGVALSALALTTRGDVTLTTPAELDEALRVDPTVDR